MAAPKVGGQLFYMQQSLGRNAADVKAYTPECRVALHQHDLLAKVGRPEGGGIPAGTGPQHDDIAFNVRGRTGRKGCSRRRHRRSRRCRRRRLGFGGAGLVQRQHERTFSHFIADLDLDFLHHTGSGRRDLHGRLVRLDRDQRGFFPDGVAGLYEDLDDADFLEVADVGHLDFDGLGHC